MGVLDLYVSSIYLTWDTIEVVASSATKRVEVLHELWECMQLQEIWETKFSLLLRIEYKSLNFLYGIRTKNKGIKC